MKEFFLAIGWLTALVLGYLNYTQSRQINILKQRLNDAEAARRYDHDAYRQIMKDFAEIVSDASMKKKVVDRVDAIFDRAFAEAEKLKD